MKPTCDYAYCTKPVFSHGRCFWHQIRKPIRKKSESNRVQPVTKSKKVSYGRKEISEYSKSQVKKDLTIIFNAWARMRTADEYGIVECPDSGKRLPWQKVDAGHYLPRSVAPGLIYHPDNVWPQAKIDNWLEGNRLNYREGLIKKIGLQRVESLELAQHMKSGIGLFEMKIMLWDYIEKFKAECIRLHHEPNKTQQRVLDRWETKKAQA